MRLEKGDFCGLEDETTIGQLAGIRYKSNSRGQVEIESKADAKKRGVVKSPDRAESVMLAFAGISRTYGALDYYHDLEKSTMNKVQSSRLIKPVTNEKTLECPSCQSVSITMTNGANRCSNCGYTWQTDKAKIPAFSRSDLAKVIGGKNGRRYS